MTDLRTAGFGYRATKTTPSGLMGTPDAHLIERGISSPLS